jgi:hypothetical protein
VVRAHISTPQSSISAATTIVYDTEDTDSQGGYNPSTGLFTVPASCGGDYVVTASLRLTQVSSTGVVRMSIEKNGSEVVASGLPSVGTNTDSTALSCSCVLPGLVPTDVIRVRLLTSAGTATTVASGGSQFSLVKVPHA